MNLNERIRNEMLINAEPNVLALVKELQKGELKPEFARMNTRQLLEFVKKRLKELKNDGE